MATIADIVASAQTLGLFEFYLPFIIMFAITYGLLRKTNIFGKADEAKSINLIISLAVSAFILLYPTTQAAVVSLSEFFSSFFSGTLIIIATILAFMMMMYIVVGGSGKEMKFDNVAKWAIIPIIILVFGVFLISGGFGALPNLGNFYFNPQLPYLGAISTSDLAIVLIIVLTGAAIFWMSKGEKHIGGKEKE